MRISEVARTLGLDAPTIRFYEAEGIVPPPGRGANGYRNYDNDGIEALRFVSLARSLGIPLADIRQILAFRDEGQPPCNYVRTVIDRQADTIEQRISDLQHMASELRRLQHVAQTLPETPYDDPCVCHILTNQKNG